MGIFIGGLKKTRAMSNQTCHFGSLSGLPPRVGVPINILTSPNYELFCRASKNNPNCCCLPISSTWHMNCKEARAWLKEKGYDKSPNQVSSGQIGSRRLLLQY